ncbi:serine/threonine-protein kinase [Compostimonas suwonensis]|uniref:non-specific serine/threonine protein kinase n=2 Tax=Compostimonas suwonensis TaxID=1048394 RepID=A0A2M9BAZ4_9MICO|nr:serine/threonine-protein kinase [Compostimonas suwonensis]
MIGRLIDGRYQVRSRIARGGMATVYLATDLRLERRVAIKIMHGHLADDSTFKNRFVQEARQAARLAHPNVVNVFDQGQDSDMAYLVMEYLPGITLRDLIKDRGTLTTEQTLDIMEAILSGLSAAHKAGIVHRDLKPENVLLADDGRIKIGDFGLARAASANTATGQALLGTIAYLSPELVTRGIADTRSDIYALGIMMFEMLTGEQPFQGEQPMQIAYQHANDTVPLPSSKNPRVPVELDELVLWSTEKDPEKRPRDAKAFLDQVLEVSRHLHENGGTLAVGSTAVMPAALATELLETDRFSTAESNAETQAFTQKARHKTGPVVDDSATALTAAAARRRRRGGWIFGLVILLAALAAGTGWYFSAGPGGFVTIPVVRGMAPELAQQQLEELGFEVASEQRSDVEIPAGTVSGSSPDGQTTAQKGTQVTLYVSSGPKMIAVTDVVGMPEDQARAALADFAIGDSIRQFSDQAAGVVLAATDGAGQPLPAEYGERQPITLVVSAGAIPDVAGLSVDDATAALTQAGLTVSPDQQEDFSDDVDAGLVIGAITQTDPVRANDPMVLNVSKGPDLVEVPDVSGVNVAEGKATLEAAGFTVEVNSIIPEGGWGLPGLVVSSTDPAGGEQLKRGSTVTIQASL